MLSGTYFIQPQTSKASVQLPKMLFPFNVETTQTVKNACTYTQTLSLTTSDEYEIVEISMNEMTLSKLYSNHCNINNHAQADP